MAEVKAQWSLSLDCTCPNCEEYFDILEVEGEFFMDGGPEPIEHGTTKTTDREVTCPQCHHEFNVDFEW
jgi:hypothetical protein